MNRLSSEKINENWDRLLGLVSAELLHPAEYLDMMVSMERDWIESPTCTYLGFKRAPAASGNHHAYEGGLVHHLLEMWEVWKRLNENNCLIHFPHVSNDRVMRAIVNHDIHKAYKTYVLEMEDPWQVRYGADLSDTLMTWDTKNIWVLMQHGIKMDPEQMNALLWAEGGFSKIKPRECSVLSKICYLIDEMSGNVMARLDKGNLLDRKTVIG